MTAIPLHFQLPANLSAKKFLSKLSKKTDLQIASHQYMIKSFYDSFDWRLYRADLFCEYIHSQSVSFLNLIRRNNGERVVRQSLLNVPNFVGQFPDGPLKQELEPVLEMRALLPLCQLPLESYQVNILNKDQKTVLRMQIDEYEILTHHVCLHPMKGYEKAALKISQLLQQSLDLKTAPCSVLDSALKLHGRKPKDYNSKFTIQLKPEMQADKAGRIIFQQLLDMIHANEAGTIADIDSEFLHDFRIAVRCTRAGLNQMKHILPAPVISQYGAFFAWLGHITGPTRDLDVYLLNYQHYESIIPDSLRNDITPLYSLLKYKQSESQRILAKKLQGTDYRKQLSAWEQFLNDPLQKKFNDRNADLTVKRFADNRIWKMYRRLINEGNMITGTTPAEALHDLRKTCKKLRYLMEFFQSLYPQNEIRNLLKALKGFQSVLGDFQDYEVQEIKLKAFSEEMMNAKVDHNTLLAMGVLIQYLDSRRCSARNNFSDQFKSFKHTKNECAFKRLFHQDVKVIN